MVDDYDNFFSSPSDEDYINANGAYQNNSVLSQISTLDGVFNWSYPAKNMSSHIVDKRHVFSDRKLSNVLFWDCLMFINQFEGEDFYLRLSDEAKWGAQLSFRVPTIDRHGESLQL